MRFGHLYYCIYLIGLAVVMAMASGCSGEEEEVINEGAPGFLTSIYTDDVLPAELIFDLDSVLYYKDTDPDKERDGELVIDTGDSTLYVQVEIRTRGVTRKKMCSFPPLRVQLEKKAVRKYGWADFRNYKLVTHCSDSLREDELLFREYLVYKLYERLTNLSLRAQLLDLEYVTPNDTMRRFAVILENEEEMCDRLRLKELDIDKTKLTSIHFEHYKRFALFQYMVGNTDWNLGTGHNTKYVLEEGSSTPIVIPYDFDYSGLVNAPYATPYETLPIDDVRERYLMYRGKKSDDFSAIRDEFIALKDDWYKIVNDFEYLSEESKADVRSFLGEFFTVLEQPDWKDRMFPS